MQQLARLCLAGLVTLSAGRAFADEKVRDPASPWDVRPAMVGSTIPKATVLTWAGEDFDLNRSVASTPTILIFYRGGW